MPIAVVHLAVCKHVAAAPAIDPPHFDDHILGFPTVGASVHAQRSANPARNASEEGKP